jgi:hypothetical protein
VPCENKIGIRRIYYLHYCHWAHKRGTGYPLVGAEAGLPLGRQAEQQQQHRERWLNDLARFPVHFAELKAHNDPFSRNSCPVCRVVPNEHGTTITKE